MKLKYRFRLAAFMVPLLGLFSTTPVSAQTVIEIDPLFEYPVAPETLQTMSEKSDYVIEHFWDNFNLKSKDAVDQNALNHAFKVYSTAIRFANKDKALQVNQKLINNLIKNPVLLQQFLVAAEENIYGPRAEVWIDELYEQYLKAAASNKKIKDKRRERYANQLSALTSSAVGKIAPRFPFQNLKDENAVYFPMSTPTIIIFGNPKDTDWRLARLKLESNITFLQALEKGKLNVLFIIPKEFDDWKDSFSDYSDKWTIGVGEELEKLYDLRRNPAIYVVGSDGKIMEKNSSIFDAVNLALQNIN